MTRRFYAPRGVKLVLRSLFVCFCLTLACAAAVSAQTAPPATDVAADLAKSEALTAAQHEQAQKLFATAFGLLQSGDAEAAKLGFERGLAIDPANSTANFYLAELLVRLGDNAGARTHYGKVIALDADSSEGLKAQVALKTLSQTFFCPTAETARNGYLLIGQDIRDEVTFSDDLVTLRHFHNGELDGVYVRYNGLFLKSSTRKEQTTTFSPTDMDYENVSKSAPKVGEQLTWHRLVASGGATHQEALELLSTGHEIVRIGDCEFDTFVIESKITWDGANRPVIFHANFSPVLKTNLRVSVGDGTPTIYDRIEPLAAPR